MVCCEICNRAGDECAVTGTPIDWSEFGVTVMPDCPERKDSDYEGTLECSNGRCESVEKEI